MLNEAEIRMILHALCPEGGYSTEPLVRKLQAKLSIMLQVVCDRARETRVHAKGA